MTPPSHLKVPTTAGRVWCEGPDEGASGAEGPTHDDLTPGGTDRRGRSGGWVGWGAY